MKVEVRNLNHFYGSFQALKNVSFEARKGEVMGLLGPNGAGKSTTMKIITCFLIPTSGEVRVGDYSVYENPLEIRRIIGYLPENNPLYLDMITWDFLEFVGNLYGIKGKKLRDKIGEVAEICGITKYLNRKIEELSKGYRQRVGLASILIHDPEVLILDEPTAGLDPIQVLEIREVMRRIGKERTLILSTHILQEVEAVCDRVVIINKGEIVADDTVENMRMKVGGLSSVVVSIEVPDGTSRDEIVMSLKGIEGVESIHGGSSPGKFIIGTKTPETVKREVFKMCAEKGWVVLELTVEKHKLEEVFRMVVSN